MRVLLTTYGGRRDVERLVGLAVRLPTFGAEVRVCAQEDCAERLAEVGVPLVPAGQPACCDDPWCADNARHKPGPKASRDRQ